MMKKNILLFSFILFFVTGKLFSQAPTCNLIQNGDFETYSSCPIGNGEMNKATPWNQGTTSAAWPSSDFFHQTCGFMNVGGGINPPLPFPSGVGCAGVYTNYGLPSNAYYKEEAAQKLNFCVGQKYKLELYAAKPASGSYINIAGNLSFEIGNAAVLPTNNVNATTFCANGFVSATSIAGSLITSAWQPFTRFFTATQNADAFMITGLCNGPHTTTGYVFFDKLVLTTVDTLTVTPTTISTCDSANFTITIPGSCYGPYDVIITNGTTIDTLNNINSGYVHTVFPTQSTTYTITSITNSFGCITPLNIPITVIGGSATTSTINQSICTGSSYTLPGGTVVSTAGTYIDTLISSSGCDSIVTTTLLVNSLPVAGVSPDISIMEGSSTTLIATGGGSYSWSPSAGLNVSTGNSVTASPSQTTVYCVLITDSNGCTDTACVTVAVEESPCNGVDNLGVPNAFSPNNDNINDEFCLQGWDNCVELFNIQIYDRWGQMVYESTDPAFCWDGKYKGSAVDAAVFVYSINAIYKNVEKPVIKKGNISLIR